MLFPISADAGSNKPVEVFINPFPCQVPIPGMPCRSIGVTFSQIDSGAVIDDSVS